MLVVRLSGINYPDMHAATTFVQTMPYVPPIFICRVNFEMPRLANHDVRCRSSVWKRTGEACMSMCLNVSGPLVQAKLMSLAVDQKLGLVQLALFFGFPFTSSLQDFTEDFKYEVVRVHGCRLSKSW
jgi:hypothetical protein